MPNSGHFQMAAGVHGNPGLFVARAALVEPGPVHVSATSPDPNQKDRLVQEIALMKQPATAIYAMPQVLIYYIITFTKLNAF